MRRQQRHVDPDAAADVDATSEVDAAPEADATPEADAIPETDATPEADAAPAEHSVRITAVGVLQPLSLRLEFTGGSEFLSITEDGTVAFDTLLSDGDSYSVVFEATPPCVLDSDTGTIAGGNSGKLRVRSA